MRHRNLLWYPNDSIIRSIIVVMILFIWQKALTEKISYSVSFTCPFSYLRNAPFLGQHQK